MYRDVTESVIPLYNQLKGEITLGLLSSVLCTVSACVFFFLGAIPITADNIASPIACLTDMPSSSEKAIESYCYVQGKFTLEGDTVELFLRENVHRDFGEKTVRNTHRYYVWVGAIFFLCFVSTFLGQIVYANFGGNTLSDVISSIGIVKSAGENMYTLNRLLTMDRLKRDAGIWSTCFICFEFINCISPFAQFYMINLLLQGRFLYLGFYIYNEQVLEFIFPKQAKCDFHTFGPSGTVQNHDILCILGSNFVNEKIFLAAWFWLVPMIVLSFVAVFRRIASVCLYKTYFYNYIMWKISRTNSKKGFILFLAIRKHLSFSEWLYLAFVNDNVEVLDIVTWLQNIAGEIPELTEEEKEKLLRKNEEEVELLSEVNCTEFTEGQYHVEREETGNRNVTNGGDDTIVDVETQSVTTRDELFFECCSSLSANQPSCSYSFMDSFVSSSKDRPSVGNTEEELELCIFSDHTVSSRNGSDSFHSYNPAEAASRLQSPTVYAETTL